MLHDLIKQEYRQSCVMNSPDMMEMHQELQRLYHQSIAELEAQSTSELKQSLLAEHAASEEDSKSAGEQSCDESTSN